MFNEFKEKDWLTALTTGIGLSIAYFTLLYLLNGASHAVESVYKNWFLLAPLSALFGAQVSLYFFAKRKTVEENARKKLAASTVVSGSTMAACCAHHAFDVIPLLGFLGISSIGAVLAKYDQAFLAIGVLSGLFGLLNMLSIMRVHKIMKTSFNPTPWKNAVIALLALSTLTLAGAMAVDFTKPTYSSQALQALAQTSETSSLASFDTLTDAQNDVTVSITPKIEGNTIIAFSIKIDNHELSLNEDLVKQTELLDSKGNSFQPLKWDGSPTGGHHRTGVLYFPKINTGSLKLILNNVGGASQRIFEWKTRS